MPPKAKDLTGMRFGRLVVLSRAENSMTGKPMWNCLCDCGNECVKQGSALVSGDTKSCGCYNREKLKARAKHGDAHGRLYSVWNMMKQRCGDQNNKSYKNYGQRGISVCEEWKNSYELFRDWALSNGYDANAKTHKCTIDRIDNNGNYCPENCRFVSATEQARNMRSNNIVTYKGQSKTLSEWSEETGIRAITIGDRLRHGWSVEEALTIKPIIGRNQTWRRTQ